MLRAVPEIQKMICKSLLRKTHLQMKAFTLMSLGKICSSCNFKVVFHSWISLSVGYFYKSCHYLGDSIVHSFIFTMLGPHLHKWVVAQGSERPPHLASCP